MKTAIALLEPGNDNWRKTVPIWVLLILDKNYPGWRKTFTSACVRQVPFMNEIWVDVCFGGATHYFVKGSK